MYPEVHEKARQAREAARFLATASSAIKNRALEHIAGALKKETPQILKANAIDLHNLKQKEGYSMAFHDRLLLNEARLEGMAESLRQIAALEDPVGEVLGMSTRPNGLQVGRVRVPIGVIGIIYEARPNVTVDAAALTLKAGNAVILRGSSEAIHSNKILVEIIQASLKATDLPPACVSLIEDTDRAAALELMRLNDYLDLLIPRGGPALIRTVIENSTIPLIQTGAGNCHIYVDAGADLEAARAIVLNAKIQRPGVCNAAETLLVHAAEAKAFLPKTLEALLKANVELRGCPQTCQYDDRVRPASEKDWATEYLDLILAVKIVEGFEEAIDHINDYGTKHSEAIVTRDYLRSRRFQNAVDAAAVFVNASTRFTDGFEFGLGAEMGISTQKLHARGPMGLKELTSLKFIVFGEGQIRT